MAATVFASSFRFRARAGARRRGGNSSEAGIRADLFMRKRVGMRSGEELPATCRCGSCKATHDRGVGMPRSASAAAQKTGSRVERDERTAASPRRAPEELRLLEALLFASPVAARRDDARAPAAGRRRCARGACASCRTNMRRAASIWSGSARNGHSAPPPICPG